MTIFYKILAFLLVAVEFAFTFGLLFAYRDVKNKSTKQEQRYLSRLANILITFWSFGTMIVLVLIAVFVGHF